MRPFTTTRSVLLLSAFSAIAPATAQNTFQRLLPADFSTGQAVATTPAGDVIVAGNWTTYGIGLTRAHVVKYTATGSMIWSTQVFIPASGAYSHTWVDALAARTDGGVFLAGTTYENDQDSLYIACLDGNGALQWARKFDPPLPDLISRYVYDMAVAPNGDVLVAGALTIDPGTMQTDAFITRFTSDGTHQWTRRIAAPIAGTFNFIGGMAFPSAGGIVAAGRTQLLTEGSWLMKLADDGSVQWVKRYSVAGNVLNFPPAGVVPTSTGYAVYYAEEFDTGNPLMRVNTDSDGNAIDARNYAVPADDFVDIGGVRAMAGGSTLVAGSLSHTLPLYDTDAFMMALNADGTVQWAQAYGSPGYEQGAAATPTSDGGFLLTGNGQLDSLTIAHPDEERGGVPVDSYIVKTDGAGNSFGCEEAATVASATVVASSSTYSQTFSDLTGWGPIAFSTSNDYVEVSACVGLGIGAAGSAPLVALFPNPAHQGTILATTERLVRVDLIDASGRTVFSRRSTHGDVHIDLSALPSGAYSVRAISHLGATVLPLIVQ